MNRLMEFDYEMGHPDYEEPVYLKVQVAIFHDEFEIQSIINPDDGAEFSLSRKDEETLYDWLIDKVYEQIDNEKCEAAEFQRDQFDD